MGVHDHMLCFPGFRGVDRTLVWLAGLGGLGGVVGGVVGGVAGWAGGVAGWAGGVGLGGRGEGVGGEVGGLVWLARESRGAALGKVLCYHWLVRGLVGIHPVRWNARSQAQGSARILKGVACRRANCAHDW